MDTKEIEEARREICRILRQHGIEITPAQAEPAVAVINREFPKVTAAMELLNFAVERATIAHTNLAEALAALPTPADDDETNPAT